jgi:mannose-6-phosphate isomerase-like protein (cupin superfamily)
VSAGERREAFVDERTGLSIVERLPREQVMEGHHAPASIYLAPEDAPGVAVTVAAVDASELVEKPLADLHTHSVDEIYLVVTPGLHFAVETDAGSVELSSPVSVRIPSGTPHRFVVREAEVSPCPLLGLLLEPRERAPDALAY